MHLTVDDQGVDDPAAVVDGDVPLERHLSRLRVHLHDGDVRAEGEREVRGIVERGGLQRRLDPRREVPRQVRLQRDLLNGLGLIGAAADVEPALVEHDVLLRGLEQVRGDLRGLLPHPAGGQHDRGAADHGRAAAVGPPPHRPGGRVAVHDLDIVNGKPQFVGHDLGERGLLTLPVRRRPGEDGRFGGRVQPHHGALPQSALEAGRADHGRRPQPADLHVGAEPDAEQLAVPRAALLLLTEAPVVHRGERLVEGRAVVPAVVGQPLGGRVRKLVGRDEVLAANVGGIQFEVRRHQVDDPLDEVRRLRPPRPTIRIDGGGVGEHAVDHVVEVGNRIAARQHQAVEDRRDPRPGG